MEEEKRAFEITVEMVEKERMMTMFRTECICFSKEAKQNEWRFEKGEKRERDQ